MHIEIATLVSYLYHGMLLLIIISSVFHVHFRGQFHLTLFHIVVLVFHSSVVVIISDFNSGSNPSVGHYSMKLDRGTGLAQSLLQFRVVNYFLGVLQ